jgi:hypothetical protein
MVVVRWPGGKFGRGCFRGRCDCDVMGARGREGVLCGRLVDVTDRCYDGTALFGRPATDSEGD